MKLAFELKDGSAACVLCEEKFKASPTLDRRVREHLSYAHDVVLVSRVQTDHTDKDTGLSVIKQEWHGRRPGTGLWKTKV